MIFMYRAILLYIYIYTRIFICDKKLKALVEDPADISCLSDARETPTYIRNSKGCIVQGN